MPTFRNFTPVRFRNLPPGSSIVVEFKMEAQTAEVAVELEEITGPSAKTKDFVGSLLMAVIMDCIGKVTIPITGDNPKGTVSYLVKNGAKNIRPAVVHDLSTLKLKEGETYLCRIHAQAV